jgi:bifunctional non-homologous end joining protein LigD
VGQPAKLAKYKAKRDFARTPEPSGKRTPKTSGYGYVIQKHAARRLHYDFRLELDGVLLSWSVPKGPSLSPGEKRLAVRTEDHPLDYADFEGVIPKGEYGGGTVVVWDRGTWQPEGDAREAMKKGRLTFSLEGEKLSGKWHLIRTKGIDKQESWLLFKSRDEAANENNDITESAPKSVNAIVKQLPLGFALTNLEKVLYPDAKITKGQVIAYLAVVAEHMLPYVADRPLTLVRCPEGCAKPCFYQQKIDRGAPKVVVTSPQIHVRDMPGLVALAQLGTLEIHTWGCHIDKLERPDFMVFDLDPDPAVPWERVALTAIEMRKRLGDLGLESWVKTTGGKGLHVCVPVERRLEWDAFKQWSKDFADRLADDDPKAYTTNMAKAQRKHRIYIDYLRNGRNATFIAPYSMRAREGASVSVPITWDELAIGIAPADFTILTVPQRLAQLERDPWAGIRETKQAVKRRPR